MAEFLDKVVVKKPTKYACTVVSLLPYSFVESKPHMIPFTFEVPAADKDFGFGILHVEEGLHFIPNPFDDKMNYRQVTPPNEMARSIVDDYANSCIGTDTASKPGLFWVEGRYTLEGIKKEFAAEIAEAEQLQRNWFKNLVMMADTDWAKHKNAMAVSDLQRHAARYLNAKRDWVDPIATVDNTCPFCKAVIDPSSVKCFNCKEVVNVEKYKEMVNASA